MRYYFCFFRAIPCVIRSSTIASITTAIPPSNPMPIFIWVIPFKTTSPRPPAEIMAATTTFFGTCRRPNAVSLATGGRAKMIVAKASGTVPIL